MRSDAELEEFRSLIDEAQRVVVFTGAGISTESGIPDFRSPGCNLDSPGHADRFLGFHAFG